MVAHFVDLRTIAWVLGSFLAALVGCMLVPFGYALVTGQDHSVFVPAALVTAVVAAIMMMFGRHRERRDLHHREGILLVSLIWIVICVFGALPFYFSGSFLHTAHYVIKFVYSCSNLLVCLGHLDCEGDSLAHITWSYYCRFLSTDYRKRTSCFRKFKYLTEFFNISPIGVGLS